MTGRLRAGKASSVDKSIGADFTKAAPITSQEDSAADCVGELSASKRLSRATLD
jgi:hypothetical protein